MSRLRKRYSVRNKPTPSAPYPLTAEISVVRLDVGRERHRRVVQRDGGLVAQLAQPILARQVFPRQLAVLEQRLIGRIHDQHAVETVEQGVLAGAYLLTDILHTHHGRQLQRLRQDGRVRSVAAPVRRKAHDELLIELRGL